MTLTAHATRTGRHSPMLMAHAAGVTSRGPRPPVAVPRDLTADGRAAHHAALTDALEDVAAVDAATKAALAADGSAWERTQAALRAFLDHLEPGRRPTLDGGAGETS